MAQIAHVLKRIRKNTQLRIQNNQTNVYRQAFRSEVTIMLNRTKNKQTTTWKPERRHEKNMRARNKTRLNTFYSYLLRRIWINKTLEVHFTWNPSCLVQHNEWNPVCLNCSLHGSLCTYTIQDEVAVHRFYYKCNSYINVHQDVKQELIYLDKVIHVTEYAATFSSTAIVIITSTSRQMRNVITSPLLFY